MLKARTMVCVASLVAAGAGCSDFLSGVAGDPNNPSTATRDQLFIAAQAGQFGQQEAAVAQVVCMWMQQCAGIGGRFVDQRGRYNFTPVDFSFDFTSVYIGAGLVDLRQVQASADADGDQVYGAIARIWEALVIGSAADVWGDIPYREAGGSQAHPALDPQLQVYTDLQALLDRAIADLAGSGSGPGAHDLVFGGDAAAWTAAANTLKARYHLHTVERLGDPAYDAAIAAAANGIASAGGDWRAFHTDATQEANLWYQFSTTSFGQDIVAGKALVDLMLARSDPRLPEYFGLNALGGYGGEDVNSSVPANEVSPLNGTRNAPDFRQPLVTWAENQLILAEAKLVRQGAAAAQPHLDAVRASLGLASVPATLQAIMEEKYVALFQNIEAWSDYRRTCIPALAPFATTLYQDKIPGRLYYGSSEQNANPNIPGETDQLVAGGVGFRNPADPAPCP
ncbi:MAG: SusD/RagB family nutrient-binding outer membrane lipoprotein [Gemmatimonadales bacterium]